MVEREKFADAVLICTPDCLHKVNIQYTFMFCMCISQFEVFCEHTCLPVELVYSSIE